MSSAQLCFGNVHHTRLSPVRNRFNYGVYFLRLPLRELEARPAQSKLFSRNRFNLLSHYDKDHGDGEQPLLAWIEGVLKAQGIHDADGEVWLQTFPRVLGYVFNPVSFWFCHRRDGELRAILCEVSNTFGERHCYLLDEGGPIANATELSAKKIFHVSPFCAVEGRYRFQFIKNQRAAHEDTLARIDYHTAAGALLLTNISGSSRPLTDANIVRALLRYPLMTFMVIARIHWQALKLWIKRVPFYRKPAPPIEELSK
ncbi:DUF1365 domain-containing protein [Ferrigenium sp. UT5]|uniref:DUF1365 domain-containing protein n=1 Tax=Ferrigenium sp. UT5 TaxID=3242105 RepID=UPI003550AEE8